MRKTYEIELAGRQLKIEVGKVAAQANGAVLIQYDVQTVV